MLKFNLPQKIIWSGKIVQTRGAGYGSAGFTHKRIKLAKYCRSQDVFSAKKQTRIGVVATMRKVAMGQNPVRQLAYIFCPHRPGLAILATSVKYLIFNLFGGILRW